MIRHLIPFIILLLTHIYASANVRVLTIGISEYPKASGWNNINAHNDVVLIQQLFPSAILLENENASKEKIEAQLKAMAYNAEKGDTVIIHFSGHGQQIRTNSSPKEIDGVDEAIVPYDAEKRKTASYFGQNHLTDDAFGTAVERLRQAVGPNGLVIAVIDACHSDSMDKDADASKEIYRGTDEIFGAENMSDEEIASLRKAYHCQDTTALKVSADMGNVVYISACRSDQRNYEVVEDCKGYGSLTYYFCEAYKSNGLSDLPALLSAIYSGMENDQTLQFHGQVPSIRNTVGWDAPTKVAPPIPDPPVGLEEPEDPSNQTVIWGIIGLAVVSIFSALWIKRKK